MSGLKCLFFKVILLCSYNTQGQAHMIRYLCYIQGGWCRKLRTGDLIILLPVQYIINISKYGWSKASILYPENPVFGCWVKDYLRHSHHKIQTVLETETF